MSYDPSYTTVRANISKLNRHRCAYDAGMTSTNIEVTS